MVTGDHAGYVKYWQSNMNNVKMFQAHKEALRGIRYLQLLSSVLQMQICIYKLVILPVLINITYLILTLVQFFFNCKGYFIKIIIKYKKDDKIKSQTVD